MKIETVNLKVPVYFVQGMHTCARHFDNGEVCPFRMALSFGQADTCYWLKHGELHRNDSGFLIPDKLCCPLAPLITAEAERLEQEERAEVTEESCEPLEDDTQHRRWDIEYLDADPISEEDYNAYRQWRRDTFWD
jgi:hypothetical protein